VTRKQVKDWLEGVGFLAVIASLIFVGIETRNGVIQAELNTEAIEMAAYQELIQSINDMNALALQVPELRELSLRLEDGETGFDASELEIASYWLWMRIRHGDMAFFQYQRGAINESRLRSTLAPLIGLLSSPYGREQWQRRQKNFVPEFQDYVNRLLDEVEASDGRYLPFLEDVN
jgi:hypothetical protein